MLRSAILLFLISTVSGSISPCPSSKEVQQLTNFQGVVVQDPFPDYPGVDVFNGVTYQKMGICSETGIMCYNNNCTQEQTCRPLSQELLFNLIPTNSSEKLDAKDISDAVKSAKNITYTGYFYPLPSIPSILCMYDISDLSDRYSCLPKSCNDRVCMKSSKTCDCVPFPCMLYYAVKMPHK